jgi:ribosomal protein S21
VVVVFIEKSNAKMKYYIKNSAWEAIFSVLKTFKRVHTKEESKLSKLMERGWYDTNSQLKKYKARGAMPSKTR